MEKKWGWENQPWFLEWWGKSKTWKDFQQLVGKEENCQKENLKPSWEFVHFNLSGKGRTTTTKEVRLFQFTVPAGYINTWEHKVWSPENQQPGEAMSRPAGGARSPGPHPPSSICRPSLLHHWSWALQDFTTIFLFLFTTSLCPQSSLNSASWHP